MFPLAHIGIAVFVGTFLFLPILPTLIGALLPDIVDKALFLIGLAPYTRFIGHTVFFGPILCLIVYSITKKREYAMAVLFGSYIHLLLDVQRFVPWFYPLLSYDFPPVSEFEFGLFEFATESLGAALVTTTIIFDSKLSTYRERLSTRIKALKIWPNRLNKRS
jgi:hypothetical protein